MTLEDEESPSTKVIEGFKAIAFFPADHAQAESGKVYANGAYWNVLRFPAFPALLPGSALVAVVQQPFHASHADHGFEMTLEAADGARLPLRIEGQFRAVPDLHSRYGEAGLVVIAVPIYGLQFERPGDYAFVFCVDGQELSRYSFHVIQVPGLAMAPSVQPPAT